MYKKSRIVKTMNMNDSINTLCGLNLKLYTKEKLLSICAERGILKCKSKTKAQLVELLEKIQTSETQPEPELIVNVTNANANANANTNTNILRIVDLFAGTGAFSTAFNQTNARTVFANDMLESAEIIYNVNHPNDAPLTCKNLNDIPTTEIPACDLVTGGFPCQPFSIAGMQKGFEDERSNVFWKIVSILQSHRPRFALLENVKNLQSHDNGNTFRTIMTALHNAGYHVKHAILNTCKITHIPQNRERIYIACFRDRADYDAFTFDDIPTSEPQPIADFLEHAENVPEKYYYRETSAIYPVLREAVTKPNTVYQYRRYYVRENKNAVCPTLTANMGSGGHNVPIILDSRGIRKLTPRECFHLQGFPKEYVLPSEKLSDAKLYSLAGNAVSLPVVQVLANKIIGLLQ